MAALFKITTFFLLNVLLKWRSLFTRPTDGNTKFTFSLHMYTYIHTYICMQVHTTSNINKFRHVSLRTLRCRCAFFLTLHTSGDKQGVLGPLTRGTKVNAKINTFTIGPFSIVSIPKETYRPWNGTESTHTTYFRFFFFCTHKFRTIREARRI